VPLNQQQLVLERLTYSDALTSAGAAETQRRALNISPPLLRAWKSGAIVAIRRPVRPIEAPWLTPGRRPCRVPPVVLSLTSAAGAEEAAQKAKFLELYVSTQRLGSARTCMRPLPWSLENHIALRIANVYRLEQTDRQ
jgi:hypothetical protein